MQIEFLIDSESFEMIVAPFVKNLRKLGIDAKTRFVEENQYQTRTNNYDFDIVVGMFGQALIPGDELFAYFHSSQKDIKGGRNLAGLNDGEVDKLVEKISRVKIGLQAKRELKNLCQKLDQRMLENYYTAPQRHNNTYRILYRNIFAMPKNPPKYSLAVDTWWFADSKK